MRAFDANAIVFSPEPVPLLDPSAMRQPQVVGLEHASRRRSNARTAPGKPIRQNRTSMIVSYTSARRGLLLR